MIIFGRFTIFRGKGFGGSKKEFAFFLKSNLKWTLVGKLFIRYCDNYNYY